MSRPRACALLHGRARPFQHAQRAGLPLRQKGGAPRPFLRGRARPPQAGRRRAPLAPLLPPTHARPLPCSLPGATPSFRLGRRPPPSLVILLGAGGVSPLDSHPRVTHHLHARSRKAPPACPRHSAAYRTSARQVSRPRACALLHGRARPFQHAQRAGLPLRQRGGAPRPFLRGRARPPHAPPARSQAHGMNPLGVRGLITRRTSDERRTIKLEVVALSKADYAANRTKQRLLRRRIERNNVSFELLLAATIANSKADHRLLRRRNLGLRLGVHSYSGQRNGELCYCVRCRASRQRS